MVALAKAAVLQVGDHESRHVGAGGGEGSRRRAHHHLEGLGLSGGGALIALCHVFAE